MIKTIETVTTWNDLGVWVRKVEKDRQEPFYILSSEERSYSLTELIELAKVINHVINHEDLPF